MNNEKRLEDISSLLTSAHARIQQDFKDLNPVVGVRRSLRQSGFPADLITIDCLKSQKRLMLLLHDSYRYILPQDFYIMKLTLRSPYQTL